MMEHSGITCGCGRVEKRKGTSRDVDYVSHYRLAIFSFRDAQRDRYVADARRENARRSSAGSGGVFNKRDAAPPRRGCEKLHRRADVSGSHELTK